MGKVGNLRRLLAVAVFIGIAAVLVGVPLAASANPDVDGFELDGNAAGNGGSDWDALGSPLEFTGFIADPTGGSDRGYTAGGSKDTNDVSQWKWSGRTVTPAKDNIANAYAAAYVEDGNLILYFGQNRLLDRRATRTSASGSSRTRSGSTATARSRAPMPRATSSCRASSRTVATSPRSASTSGRAARSSRCPTNGGECADGKLGTDNACADGEQRHHLDLLGRRTSRLRTSSRAASTSPRSSRASRFPASARSSRTRAPRSPRARPSRTSRLGSIDTCASIKITKQATPSDGTQFGYTTTGGLNPAIVLAARGLEPDVLEAAAGRLLGERERSRRRLGVRQPLLPDGLRSGHGRPGRRARP